MRYFCSDARCFTAPYDLFFGYFYNPAMLGRKPVFSWAVRSSLSVVIVGGAADSVVSAVADFSCILIDVSTARLS